MPVSETADPNGAWPEDIFGSPVLRGLDERGRHDLERYGRLLELEPDAVLFQPGEPSDALFVVARGAVELRTVARGDEAESVIRVATRQSTLGEEAMLQGQRRSHSAVCTERAVVAQLPAIVLERALKRAGDRERLERELRHLRREATRDLLKAQAFARHLSEPELELLLDSVSPAKYLSGEFIYRQGERAEHCLLLQQGLVQIQSEREGRVRVHGYLSAGDFFGDDEVVTGKPHRYSTVALGDCVALHASATVMRTLCDRNPGLTTRLRRMSVARHMEQRPFASGGVHSTEHVLRDAYRMQMARSLLVIDQDSCVRCGHCAWACAELHDGVTRLIRSGDKVLVPKHDAAQARLSNLLLPNTCQHCQHPACMIDCPTGAIGRDPEGEVFIREELCTGCGACAKACPWHNIQLAPRPGTGDAPATPSSSIAVKCDLCRQFEAPACVSACPTDAVQRLDPNQEFSAVRALSGATTTDAARPGTPPKAGWLERTPFVAGMLAFAAMAVVGPWLVPAGRGTLLWTGGLAGMGTLGLAFYGLYKRRVRWWVSRRTQRGLRLEPRDTEAPRSRISPWVRAHQSLGIVTLGAVLWHSGWSLPAGLSGLLLATFWLSAATGLFGAIGYRVLPARLARLEWRGVLPEELKAERQRLDDALYRALTGKEPRLKELAESVLLPYSRSPLSSLQLLSSGRDLRSERRRLRREIERRLAGEGAARLAGLDEVIKIVVDLRALPLRRLYTTMLRFWQPFHAGLTLLVLALLVLHVLAKV